MRILIFEDIANRIVEIKTINIFLKKVSCDIFFIRSILNFTFFF